MTDCILEDGFLSLALYNFLLFSLPELRTLASDLSLAGRSLSLLSLLPVGVRDLLWLSLSEPPVPESSELLRLGSDPPDDL